MCLTNTHLGDRPERRLLRRALGRVDGAPHQEHVARHHLDHNHRERLRGDADTTTTTTAWSPASSPRIVTAHGHRARSQSRSWSRWSWSRSRSRLRLRLRLRLHFRWAAATHLLLLGELARASLALEQVQAAVAVPERFPATITAHARHHTAATPSCFKQPTVARLWCRRHP
jgi:hypothetical protein